jgi:hypothetical protein
MIHLSHWQSFEDMHSLQVVLTSHTNAADNNSIRCLPGFMNKKHLNRHVFDGFDVTWSKNNEIYRGHECIILTSNKEELYALLSIYGYDHTFNYLTGVAQDTAQSFQLHHNIYNSNFGGSGIVTQVEKEITDLVGVCFSSWSNLNLTQTITWVTYKLLWDIHLC